MDPEKEKDKEKASDNKGADALKMFRQDNGFCDVKFIIKNGDSTTFLYYSSYMLCKCDYFKAMLTSGMKESKKTANGYEIAIGGVAPIVFEELLNYIHTGTLFVGDIDNLAELYRLADMYCLQKLTSEIIKYILDGTDLLKQRGKISCKEIVGFANVSIDLWDVLPDPNRFKAIYGFLQMFRYPGAKAPDGFIEKLLHRCSKHHKLMMTTYKYNRSLGIFGLLKLYLVVGSADINVNTTSSINANTNTDITSGTNTDITSGTNANTIANTDPSIEFLREFNQILEVICKEYILGAEPTAGTPPDLRDPARLVEYKRQYFDHIPTQMRKIFWIHYTSILSAGEIFRYKTIIGDIVKMAEDTFGWKK